MLGGLFVCGLIGSCIGAIKENNKSEIPAENWANKELYHKDIMDGVPTEQIMRNVRNGKYKEIKKYPKPPKTSDGRNIIQNSRLYNEDMKNYSAYQVQKWVEQGKYNLSPEELKKEQEYWEKKMDYLYSLL